ncbi:zinc-finger associated domain (zf-AD) domain-containing protein [Phthorimaea operculella]|nr:zinc-finger associated domain (zf-AD) domain-containing protein [Phthorimaea operculella]
MVRPLVLWHLMHCQEKTKPQKELQKPQKRRTNRKPLRKNHGTANKYNCKPKPRNKTLQAVEVKTEKLEQDILTCRVCLQYGDIPIYGVIDVSEDLKLFAGIEVAPDDSYPQYLCESCSNQLEGAISFRKTAQNSDQLLKQTREHKTNIAIAEQANNDEASCDDPVINNDTDKESYGLPESDEFDDDDLEPEYDDNKRKQKHQKRKKLTQKGNIPLADLVREITQAKEANMEFEEVRPKTLHCTKCNIGFETMEEYSDHMANEHDDIRETCPVCNNKYQPVYLRKHLALHQQEKPFMCDICGKNFKISGQLTRHRTTHFITKLEFKCPECPYRGRFKENLKLHMRTHTNDKRYQCPQCPTRYFINKSNLSRHMLTHKSERNFKCDQCQKGFNTKRNLAEHFKVDHSGIKDHVCNYCGKAFGLRQQMMKHQRKVHKRAPMRSGRTPLYMLLDSKKQQEEPSMEETSRPDCSFENDQDNIQDITIHVNI